MRHLHLVVDHHPAPTDFPPTWNEFAAARQRFFRRLEAVAVPVPDRASAEAEPPKEGSAP